MNAQSLNNPEKNGDPCNDCDRPVNHCDTCDSWFHADGESECFLSHAKCFCNIEADEAIAYLKKHGRFPDAMSGRATAIIVKLAEERKLA